MFIWLFRFIVFSKYSKNRVSKFIFVKTTKKETKTKIFVLFLIPNFSENLFREVSTYFDEILSLQVTIRDL